MSTGKKKKYTPDLSHFAYSEWQQVYEPSDDSFLLMDGLEMDIERIVNVVKPTVTLEVGSGSGVITTFLGWLFNQEGRDHKATMLTCDINPCAAEATARTLKQNKIPGEAVLTSLGTNFLPRLKNAVDVLIFNPPYVPTEEDEMNKTDIYASWAGGVDGMEVVNQFLPIAKELLSNRGVFYLVLISQNKPHEVLERIKENLNLDGEVLVERRCGEHLYILRIWHATP